MLLQNGRPLMAFSGLQSSEDGIFLTTQEDILLEFSKYYSKLYTSSLSPDISHSALTALLNPSAQDASLIQRATPLWVLTLLRK